MASRTLTFKSPSTMYCAKIDIYDGQVWSNYEPCAPTAGKENYCMISSSKLSNFGLFTINIGGSIKIKEGIKGEEIQVSFCLERRKEICSKNVTATISKQTKHHTQFK